jgi:hypothetical protein
MLCVESADVASDAMTVAPGAAHRLVVVYVLKVSRAFAAMARGLAAK